MNINLSVSPKLIERLVAAVEQLAADYADVHREELELVRRPPSNEKGRVFYQSDRELYEQEVKEKLMSTDGWIGESWTDPNRNSIPPSQRK